MNITAVQITPTSGTISAEGTMGEYGTTYLTYTLTADPDGNGGQVIGEGRGARKDGSFGVGKGAGSYYRDGTKFVMHILFRINDGTQNLDKVVFDAAKERSRMTFILLSKYCFNTINDKARNLRVD